LLHELDGGVSVLGRINDKAIPFQGAGKALSNHRLIINYQNVHNPTLVTLRVYPEPEEIRPGLLPAWRAQYKYSDVINSTTTKVVSTKRHENTLIDKKETRNCINSRN
jgi:hypothetical protein